MLLGSYSCSPFYAPSVCRRGSRRRPQPVNLTHDLICERDGVGDCGHTRLIELIIGEANRFDCGKQIAAYVGLVPEEDSSGERRRLGHISKQGNSLLRFLLVKAAQATVRTDARWRHRFFHLAKRRGRKIAKVAMARRLAIRLYWMWRRGWNYEQLESFGSHVGQPGNPHGVQ